MKEIVTYGSLEPSDLFDVTLPDTLFRYSQDEVDDFNKGFDTLYNTPMIEAISKALKQERVIKQKSQTSKIDSITQFLKTLTGMEYVT